MTGVKASFLIVWEIALQFLYNRMLRRIKKSLNTV